LPVSRTAESKVKEARSLGKHSIPPRVKKRKRSETTPEQIDSGDEVRHVEQAERAAKRMADDDPDYDGTSSIESSAE